MHVSLVSGSKSAAVVAAGLGAAVDLGYIVLTNGIQPGSGSLFYAVFIGTMAAITLVGAAPALDERLAQPFLYAATSGYLVAGIVGLASIGLFLIIAALLAYIAAGPRQASQGVAAAAMAIPVVAFVVWTALHLN